jgi:hypothetical protein
VKKQKHSISGKPFLWKPERETHSANRKKEMQTAIARTDFGCSASFGKPKEKED